MYLFMHFTSQGGISTCSIVVPSPTPPTPMAFASPPIMSKYTRQISNPTRPKTPVRSTKPTDDLDETSLAAWWNMDKTINLNNNTTPFRKQKYEPIRWANEHLLLDEDGGEFLADDPFATPAPVLKSTKRLSSVRKRNSGASIAHSKTASRLSVSSHRDLTLADLTPRSRRLSGFRAQSTKKSRTSNASARPLQLSFNGPPFAQNPNHDLEVIEEQYSRLNISPAPSAFNHHNLPTPKRVPDSPATPRYSREAQLNASPIKTPVFTRTPTRHQPSSSKPKAVVDSIKQKRKSGRPSIPVAGNVQPVQVDESDDEELHKSIPGAFDFVASQRFEPEPAMVSFILQNLLHY